MSYVFNFIRFTWPLTLGFVFLGLAVIAAVHWGVFSDSVPESDEDKS